MKFRYYRYTLVSSPPSQQTPLLPPLFIFIFMENQNEHNNSERHHREESSSSVKQQRLKRKLEEKHDDDSGTIDHQSPLYLHKDLVREIRIQVEILVSAVSLSDRQSARDAIHHLSELAMNVELVDVLVDCAVVPPLVKHLQTPPVREGHNIPLELQVEQASAFMLGLLAIKREHQQLIVDAGALPYLVDLLKRHRDSLNSKAVGGVIKRAAAAITNLANKNTSITTRVRVEGGIPPLVELLEFPDQKVRRAAAGALRTLTYRNDENINQILECNALPSLILMMRSADSALNYEAVGVIGNLVYSSPDIKEEVLAAEALQPIIRLLRSRRLYTQRQAALLIGEFATTDSNCKMQIVQRGALQPLIKMLQSPYSQLQEVSSFALGRLAQDTHNQAGIVESGGLVPLLSLLDSKNENLQNNAAFTLDGLSDNEDNVTELVRFGAVQKLQDGVFLSERTRNCVARIQRRLKEKIHGEILIYLLDIMRMEVKLVQQRVALALAHLCSPHDQKTIFIDQRGLLLVLELLLSTDLKLHKHSCMALLRLANKASSLSPMDIATPTRVQVYMGQQYVNNSTSSDVTFLVEGKQFYAHSTCLLASSEAFRVMFANRGRDAKDMDIPNIRWHVFELMMRYIYTGAVDVNLNIAQDLLRAADQYLLEGLKRLCEQTIAKAISVANVDYMFEFAEGCNASSLRDACILFILENYYNLCFKKSWYLMLIQRILPATYECFQRMLTRPIHAEVNPTDPY